MSSKCTRYVNLSYIDDHLSFFTNIRPGYSVSLTLSALVKAAADKIGKPHPAEEICYVQLPRYCHTPIKIVALEDN